MNNELKITNIDLIPVVASSGLIDILEFTEDNLQLIGWMDENSWPQGEFLKVIDDLNTISPTEFGHDAKFWDQIGKGFSIYNKFVENGNNDE